MIHFAHKKFLASVSDMATQSAHSLAFHRGLGVPTASAAPTPYTKYLDAETIEWYSKTAFAKPNFAVVANGADHGEFSKWVGEFFDNVRSSPEGESGTGLEQTKYYGGEERIAHDSGNAMVIAFPGSSSFTGKFYKPEIAVLASLLGGQSAVKWSAGFTKLGQAAAPGARVKTTSAIYSDAGLLYTTITGSARAVAATAQASVEAIQEIAAGKISSEDISKAKAAAKFQELEHGQDIRAGLELTGNGLINNTQPYQIDEVAQKIDGVTEEAVKKVGLLLSLHSPSDKILTITCRLPRNYLRAAPQYQLSAIFSYYPTLRISVSTCKYSHLVAQFRWIISFGLGLVYHYPVIVPDRCVLYESSFVQLKSCISHPILLT
jgi:ubiquinol-cytochrome c reductase core subunit 2